MTNINDYTEYLCKCSKCYNLPTTYLNSTAIAKEVAKYLKVDTTDKDLLDTLANIDSQRAC